MKIYKTVYEYKAVYEYRKYLLSHGYEETDNDGYFLYFEYKDDPEKTVMISYGNPDGNDPESVNYRRAPVDRIEISSPFVNIDGTSDGDYRAIVLHPYIKRPDPESINDSLVKQFVSDYWKDYIHDLSLFEKCIWIQQHPFEHECEMTKCHMRNMERIRSFMPELKKLGFKLYYSSMFNNDTNDYDGVSSDPILVFTSPVTAWHGELIFETDCITGDLLISHKKVQVDSITDYILNVFIKDPRDGSVYVEYRYLIDPDYSVDTFDEIVELRNILDNDNPIELKKIDFSKIPEKDFGNIISEAKCLLNTII